MLFGQIYEVQASYTYQRQAPDRVNPALRRPEDDTHPVWGIVVHFPQIRADATDPRNGDHWEIIPHVLLEHYSSRFGFDPAEVQTIVDAILHHHKIPDLGDSLAWQQPALAEVIAAVQDFPDHLDPRMPYSERREVVLARTQAAKDHLVQVGPATQTDRQGALDWRRALVMQAVEEAKDAGERLDPRYLLGIDDVAPADPLEVLTSAPLDPRRIAAMRRRDEWIAREGLPPMTFGMDRVVPPTF